MNPRLSGVSPLLIGGGSEGHRPGHPSLMAQRSPRTLCTAGWRNAPARIRTTVSPVGTRVFIGCLTYTNATYFLCRLRSRSFQRSIGQTTPLGRGCWRSIWRRAFHPASCRPSIRMVRNVNITRHSFLLSWRIRIYPSRWFFIGQYRRMFAAVPGASMA